MPILELRQVHCNRLFQQPVKITGAYPFAGKCNAAQMVAAHLSESPVPLTQRNAALPASLDRLVQRCLAKDAAHRPANAGEVLQSLDAVATPGTATGGDSRRGAAVPTPRRRTAVIVAGGVLAIAAMIALLMQRTNDGASPAASPPTASERTNAGARAATAASNRSIAVLPLANLSGAAHVRPGRQGRDLSLRYIRGPDGGH